LLRQQIKVDKTEFLLGNLVPGEKYEMTIRTATSAERTSSTAAIVEITMPNDNEYFEVGNLLVASKFQVDGHGTVNLTWEVPNEMRSKIDGYNVEYTSIRENNWRQLSFSGEQPTTILHDLKSDTEYVLKIKTRMKSGVETESGEFRFKTPKVNPNPISKVDVIYSSETNAVRVQWTLQDFVEKSQVIGYDVYISEFRDVPDNQWRYIRVDTNEQSTNIDNLPTSTTYFVKIYVRLRDGQLLKSSILYKFTTLNEYPRATQLYPRSVEIHGPKTFSYKNLSPTETEITWRFADETASSAQEARIYYTADTEEEDVNSTVWSHIDIEINQDQPEQILRLSDLISNSVYFIKAVPKLNGEYNLDHAENFSIKTATEEKREKRRHHRRRSLHHLRSHYHKHHHKDSNLVEPANSYFQVKICDPTRFDENQCDKNQRCVKLHGSNGWCLDEKR